MERDRERPKLLPNMCLSMCVVFKENYALSFPASSPITAVVVMMPAAYDSINWAQHLAHVQSQPHFPSLTRADRAQAAVADLHVRG